MRLLLLVDAPLRTAPGGFYALRSEADDSLFTEIARATLGNAAESSDRRDTLEQLAAMGLMVAYARRAADRGDSLRQVAPRVVRSCRRLEPELILLVGAPVRKSLAEPLRAAGLSVVDVRVPFPAGGHQAAFRRAVSGVVRQLELPAGAHPATAPAAEAKARKLLENSVASELVKQVDIAATVARLAERKPAFLALLSKRVEEALAGMSPRTAWSLRLLKGGKVQETLYVSRALLSTDYVRAILAFRAGREHRGMSIESGAQPVVVDAIGSAIEEFYRQPETRKLLAAEVQRQLAGQGRTQGAVEGHVEQMLSQMTSELSTLFVDTPLYTAAIDRVTDALGAFFATAAGQTLLANIGNVMATGAGKVIMYKMSTAISHAAATGAIKAGVAKIVHTVGISALLKTAIGKVVVAAAFGTAVPIEAVTLTVAAGIGLWQYRKLPQKLSEQLPGEVAQVMEGRFARTQRPIVRKLVHSAVRSAAKAVVAKHISPAPHVSLEQPKVFVELFGRR